MLNSLLFKINGKCEGEILYQIIPIPLSVRDIPGRSSQAKQELVYIAKGLQPLQHHHFCVDLFEETSFQSSSEQKKEDTNNAKTIQMLRSSDGKVFYFNNVSFLY